MSERAKSWLKLAIQLLLSAALIAFVLRQLDWQQARSLLAGGGSAGWLLAALLLFNGSKIVGALRLNIYQRHAGVHMGTADNLRLYYAGMFLNLFLPGGIGGDGYKVLVLNRRQAVPLRRLVLVLLADRLSGLACLLLLLCVLVPLLELPWPAPAIGATAAIAAAALVVATLRAHERLLGLALPPTVRITGLGLAVQLLQLACVACLLAYVRLPPQLWLPYLCVFLLSSVAAALPLTVGGIGARELTFFYALGWLGLEPTAGVVVSSGFFLVTLVSSLVGLAFLGRFSLRRGRPS